MTHDKRTCYNELQLRSTQIAYFAAVKLHFWRQLKVKFSVLINV